MPSIELRPEADEDLLELSAYVASERPTTSRNWVERIDESFQHRAEYALIARKRPELGADLRSFPVMNVVIVYRPMEDGIELVRVVHESRDLPAQFN